MSLANGRTVEDAWANRQRDRGKADAPLERDMACAVVRNTCRSTVY